MRTKQPKIDAPVAEWEKYHNDLHYDAFIKPFLKPVKTHPQEDNS